MISTSEPIELRRARDFSGQVNITAEFIRQNYRKLAQSLVRIAGVPLLLLALMPGVLWWLRYDTRTYGGADAAAGLYVISMISMVVQVLLNGVALALIISVVNAYVMLYAEHGPDGFGIGDVRRESRQRFWRVVRIMLGLSLLMAILPGFSLGWLFMGDSVSLVVGLALSSLALRFLVRWSLVFTVMFHEEGEFSDMMERCKELVRERWWLTFGVILLFFGLVLALGIALKLVPYFISVFGSADPYWDGGGPLAVLMMVLAMCATLVLCAGQAFPILAVALHYFNLVERADGTGIMERIGMIGGETDQAEPGNDERNARPEIA